jgi:WD40 repeat protein
MAHRDGVSAIALAPDGKMLASANFNDPTIVIWDPISLKTLHYLVGHRGAVQALAFSPNGKLLASGSRSDFPRVERRTLRVWNAVTGTEQQELCEQPGQVDTLSFCPKTGLLAASSFRTGVGLWDLTTRKMAYQLKGRARRLAFSPDGSIMAFTTWAIGPLALRTLPSGKQVHILKRIWKAHRTECVSFSPDGRLLAAANDVGLVSVWALGSGEKLRDFSGHAAEVTAIAFSPNGTLLASGSADSTILLWDVERIWTPDGNK